MFTRSSVLPSSVPIHTIMWGLLLPAGQNHSWQNVISPEYEMQGLWHFVLPPNCLLTQTYFFYFIVCGLVALILYLIVTKRVFIINGLNVAHCCHWSQSNINNSCWKQCSSLISPVHNHPFVVIGRTVERNGRLVEWVIAEKRFTHVKKEHIFCGDENSDNRWFVLLDFFLIA